MRALFWILDLLLPPPRIDRGVRLSRPAIELSVKLGVGYSTAQRYVEAHGSRAGAEIEQALREGRWP